MAASPIGLSAVVDEIVDCLEIGREGWTGGKGTQMMLRNQCLQEFEVVLNKRSFNSPLLPLILHGGCQGVV